MKIKPSSANTKKPLFSDKPQSSKKPTVVKCFICNQMFYSQQTFDSHMDQHQKKVDKNLPDLIQRKTIDSFGLKNNSSFSKKNSTLQSISQSEFKEKNVLNKTLKFPLTPIQSSQNPFITKITQTQSAMFKKPVKKIDQTNKSKEQIRKISESPSKKQMPADKQIQEIDEALKQSSLLMSQITFITEKYEHQEQILMAEQAQSQEESESEEEQIEKTVSQNEFIESIKKNNWSLSVIEQEILKVKFSMHKSLQNCQIQIEYLRKLIRLYSDKVALQRMSKTKSKIVAEVVKIIMLQQSPVDKQQAKSKALNLQTHEEENHQARTCSECLDMIAYGHTCTIQGDLFFHNQCYIERNESTY